MRRPLLAFALALAASTAACGDEAPVDRDVVPDAKVDASSAEAGEGDALDDAGLEDAPEASSLDAGDAGDAGDARDAAADARPVCPGSQAEPNNSLPSAALLPSIDDCDSSGGSFKGVAAGSGDPDFWHYLGTDKAFCAVDPFASTKSDVRLCVFVACSAGTTNVKSCKKGTAAVSPGGLPGCCTNGPGEVLVEHTCPLVGTDDGADVFMRVDAPTAAPTACVPYEVSYHF